MKSLVSRLAQVLPVRKKADEPVIVPDISRVLPVSPASATSVEPADPAPLETNSAQSTDFSVDELSARAEDAVSSYSDRFDEWLENDLRTLTEAWTRASRGDATENIWREVATAAHDLHGAAGSYGYPSISRLCGSLCRLLDAAGDAADPALIELHVNACKAAHAANAKSLDDDAATSQVCEALESSVRQHEVAVAG